MSRFICFNIMCLSLTGQNFDGLKSKLSITLRLTDLRYRQGFNLFLSQYLYFNFVSLRPLARHIGCSSLRLSKRVICG